MTTSKATPQHDAVSDSSQSNGALTAPIADIPQFLDALCTARSAWESTAYKVSNDSLYDLLGGCLRLYNFVWEKGNVQHPGKRRKTLKEHLEEQLEQRGIRFNENTHLATRIVRCVFETDRKRASVYSIVLRVAIGEKIAPEALPGFIRENGGIEEIRLRKSKAARSTTEAQPNPSDLLWSEEPLATIPAGVIPGSSLEADELKVALVAVRTTGAVELKWIGSSRSAFNLAASAFARSKKTKSTVVSNDTSASNDSRSELKKAA